MIKKTIKKFTALIVKISFITIKYYKTYTFKSR